jgi:hypothetical protein
MTRIQALILASLLLVLFAASHAEATKSMVTKINHPRPPMLKNEALADEDHGEVVQTAKKDSQLDPANFLVVVIAAVILVYASHRALRPPFVDMSSGSAEAMAYDEAAQAGTHLAKKKCLCQGRVTSNSLFDSVLRIFNICHSYLSDV